MTISILQHKHSNFPGETFRNFASSHKNLIFFITTKTRNSTALPEQNWAFEIRFKINYQINY